MEMAWLDARRGPCKRPTPDVTERPGGTSSYELQGEAALGARTREQVAHIQQNLLQNSLCWPRPSARSPRVRSSLRLSFFEIQRTTVRRKEGNPRGEEGRKKGPG